MKSTAVQAPVSLLLDSELTASAKLIWMVCRLHSSTRPVSPALLKSSSGLSRPTVLKALAQLDASGRYSVAGNATEADDGGSSDPKVTVPGDLLQDHRVGIQARVLYGVVHWTLESRNEPGKLTYSFLSSRTHTSPKTVRQAIRELVHSGWLQVAQAKQHARTRFSVCNPGLSRSEAEVNRVRQRLARSPFHGEALMREYLSLLIDSDDFEDNAAPGFLVNPLTDERMELDRFYPPGLAFEFNGPQHYGPTDRFSVEDAAKQRARDYMKLGICVTRGITLVTVHAEDLSLKAMQKKVGDRLPLRNVDGRTSLVVFLESMSRRYRLAARRQGWSPASRSSADGSGPGRIPHP